MRPVIKYRISFIAIAALCYTLGFQLIPQTLDSSWGLLLTIIASTAYFILLPLLYWFMVIKAGQQKAWKIIIIFSFSSFMARYSFPADISHYFEFIMWLRYPLIAVLIIMELYIIYAVVKGLWQARKLSGDPRVSIINKYQNEDEKKRSVAVTFASEPASWYYAIGRLSRKHVKSPFHINLLSAHRGHYLAIICALSLLTMITYLLLLEWSETAAILVASFIFYSVVILTANHRVSRYYSLYFQEQQLVLNNSMWGLLVVNIGDIKSLRQGCWPKKEHNTQLTFGRGESANIVLEFTETQIYYGAIGMLPEPTEKLHLCIHNHEAFIRELEVMREDLLEKSVFA